MLTAKNEKVSVNANKVLFFAQAKKGTTVILDDGTVLDLQLDYESVRRRFELCVDSGRIVPNS